MKSTLTLREQLKLSILQQDCMKDLLSAEPYKKSSYRLLMRERLYSNTNWAEAS